MVEPEVPTELDRAAVDLYIERHGREAYERGEIGETLERIDQKAEEYDPAFLSKHPELKGESITVYHDPLRGEDLAVINTQTGEVIEVLSDELRGRLVKPPAVEQVKLGNPEKLELARTLAIIDSRPKGRIIESNLREEFGDAVIDALRQGRYVVSGSAGYNPPLLVSLKGRELIQGGNPAESRLEPWQMTLDQYAVEKGARPAWVKAGYGETYRFHKRAVERAIREGKPVPAEVLKDYPDLAKKHSNPEKENPPAIDLRNNYDEKVRVDKGTLYRKGAVIQVWWDEWGKETWTGPDEKDARENFQAMKERWTEPILAQTYVEVAIEHRGTEPEGIAMADELGVRYDGILEGIAELPSKMMFTDVRQTGSTFTANTLEEARTKLADMRAKFARPLAAEGTKPKRYIIKEESEPLYKSGKKYVAYYEDGTPRYLAAETEQALKTRLLEAEPNAEFVTPPAEDILDLSKGEMMEIPLDASGKAIPLEEGNPGREAGRGETLNKLLPMPPNEGPPLPKLLQVKWPWKK